MKFRTFLLSLIVLNQGLHASEEGQLAKRVHAHILIQDYQSAVEEAREGLKKHPRSVQLLESYIAALAKAGNTKDMMRAWDYYTHLVEDPYSKREVMEVMGWSVIEKGSKSTSPLVRIVAVLGAYFGQDARGVAILQRSLRDYNAIVREVSVQVSSRMRDERLRQEMFKLFNTEQTWAVRVNVIRAMGLMKIKESKKPLMELVENNATNPELKVAAIQALTQLRENITRKELIGLAASSRAGLRQLACEAAHVFDCHGEVDQMVMLLKDSHWEVRAAALRTLGHLKVNEYLGVPITEIIAPLAKDPNDLVAITAVWVLCLHDPAMGQEAMEPWLSNSSQDVRILASSALKAAGKYGFPLTIKVFQNTNDPYVCMNLALAMVSQRQHVEEACKALNLGLKNRKERWMWCEVNNFKGIAPSSVKRNPAVPHLPEATDQLVRLEILNTLAIMHDPDAEDAVRNFLSERNWGISGAASALLLTEGDDASIDLVEGLLDDPNPKVRIQAALILAMWGGGGKALTILQEAYPDADREMKERILEGLGQVGTKESIPFLINTLKEQHPTLRIIAAAALLKVLYN